MTETRASVERENRRARRNRGHPLDLDKAGTRA
jgi:hypothetical protein